IVERLPAGGVGGAALPRPFARSLGRAPTSHLGLHDRFLATESLRLRNDPNIRLWSLPALRIDLLGLLVRDRACNDDVVTLFPVDRRRDLVLRGELQRID